MSGQDIVERLREWIESAYLASDPAAQRVLQDAIDVIASLRYHSARDAEKLAEQVKNVCELRKHAEEQARRIEALERLCGAVSDGPSYRETVKDLPRRWPEVGTHE